MHRKTIDVWVGLFVLLGLAALVFLAFQAGNMRTLSFGQTYSITSRFDNIGGLKPQAPVKSAGVVVGRVGEITFDDESFQASVRLDMESEYKFPKDSSLKILTAGLLGEQYIGIEAGGDEQNLAEGDRIIRTQSATVLEDLINQFIYSKAAEGKEGSE
ncbi:phospholipid/cholesterol/gamma-HCH transport system substrate-binding protein [Massilia sp. UYP11]|uniref:outer membrane lipid asymmetry maintenance protein MlaD n=1 Tax=Massilia sp. UYP11 TaxID=1756385 RepID=UPI003D1E8BDD